MNYFLSNLFRDKMIWIVLGLSVLAGMLIMDLLTFMLTPQAVFDLWTVKITVGAAAAWAIFYGIFLHKKEKKDRQLNVLLPGFIEERKAFLGKKAAEDSEFQTLCHKCRYFDLVRLGCLLVLRNRKAWIRLNDDSRIQFCLYWNLEEHHPVLLLTDRVKAAPEKTASDEMEERGD